jgi:hypothetical protein
VRLIPSAPSPAPLDAIRRLLAFRLPTEGREARDQWREIVEGKSQLWTGIPNDRKETIRGTIVQMRFLSTYTDNIIYVAGFLVYFESELLKRAHKNFSFVNGRCGVRSPCPRIVMTT